VSICLKEALTRTYLPKEFFFRLIDARIKESESLEVRDLVEMEIRSERIRTTIMLLTMKLLRIDLKNNLKCIEVAE